jgi:hypothetical protein
MDFLSINNIDGFPLKFRYVNERLDKFRPAIKFPKTPKSKLDYPLMDAWHGSEKFPSRAYIVAGDFDELPPGFENYDQLIAQLDTLPGVKACHSPSGKAKAFFYVRSPYQINNEYAKLMLRIVLGDLGQYSDAKGCRGVFITEEIANTLISLNRLDVVHYCKDSTYYRGTPVDIELASGLRKGVSVSDSGFFFSSSFYSILFQVLVETENNISKSNKFEGFDALAHKSTFRYFEAPEYDEVLNRFVNSTVQGRTERATFARILTACFGLIQDDGFSLSQAVLAAQCNVAPTTIHNWIKSLIECRFLIGTSSSYRVGKYAKKYAAVGLLRSAIWDYKKASQQGKSPLGKPRDGEYYQYLLRMSSRYRATHSFDQFMALVEELPGIHDKSDRIPMAKLIYRCDLQKHK